MSGRPSVSVIVPFAGAPAELEPLLGRLMGMSLRPGDELIVAHNRADSLPCPSATALAAGLRICRADAVRTAGFARNCGASGAIGEWLVFVDADTRPDASLVEAYFHPRPQARTAVLAGAVVDAADGSSLAGRHSAARNHMSQRATLTRAGAPYAQTANCAVLRSAFMAVGGFAGQIRAGEDADLCFRLAKAGWRIEERAHARVEHRGRDNLLALLAQLARHGSGAAWLNRRYPGEFPPPSPRDLVGRVARGAVTASAAASRGDRESAAFALLDVLTSSAFDLGRLLPNHARPGK